MVSQGSSRGSLFRGNSGYLRNDAPTISRDAAAFEGLSLRLACFASDDRRETRHSPDSPWKPCPAVSKALDSRVGFLRKDGKCRLLCHLSSLKCQLSPTARHGYV